MLLVLRSTGGEIAIANLTYTVLPPYKRFKSCSAFNLAEKTRITTDAQGTCNVLSTGGWHKQMIMNDLCTVHVNVILYYLHKHLLPVHVICKIPNTLHFCIYKREGEPLVHISKNASKSMLNYSLWIKINQPVKVSAYYIVVLMRKLWKYVRICSI